MNISTVILIIAFFIAIVVVVAIYIKYAFHKETISETNNKSIKGEELLNSLLIKGNYATFNTDFSNDEIYTALQKCKDLIPLPCCDSDILCNNTSSLSARQGFCSNAVIELIMDNKYNDALHEFEDCIDDYGKGKNRCITKNELILYNCILSCFISKLEIAKGNSICFSKKELETLLEVLNEYKNKVDEDTYTVKLELGLGTVWEKLLESKDKDL